LKRLAKLIELCLEKNIPFVSWRLPSEQDIHTSIQISGKFLMVEKFDEVADKPGFVYAPFHRRTNYPVVFFEPETEITNDIFEDSLLMELSGMSALYPDYSIELPFEVTKIEYLQQAEKFIHSVDAGFSKAVLSRVELLEKTKDFQTGNYFFKLQAAYPDAFCHLIHIPGNGTWMGATPETLLRMDHQTARTMALAGTQPKPEPGKEVTWQAKEIEEQAIVKEFILQILKELNIENYRQKSTGNKIAGNLVHRITEFEFDSKTIENRLAELIAKIHPTPAVCGLPKEKALNLIFQTEKHNREYYAGFCGPVNRQGQTDLFVNLRCMKILPDSLALYVGGGLTALSNPGMEWKETELKTETLMRSRTISPGCH